MQPQFDKITAALRRHTMRGKVDNLKYVIPILTHLK